MPHPHPRYRDSWLVRVGLLIACIGSLPLLSIIISAELGLTSDPDPNPVVFGIIAYVTFWPGLMVAGFGAMRVWAQRRGT